MSSKSIEEASVTTDTTTDTTAPTVSSSSPADATTSFVSSTIAVTFSEAMDTTTVTTNTSYTTCSGTLQVSSDSFSSCVQMSASPSLSNSNKTFTVTPSSSLSTSTTYKIRVTAGVRDSAGNVLSSQYTHSTGFTVSVYLLPDTGQTASYTTTFGEDHDYTINPPAFDNSSAGTVTDNNTKLMWQRQDDGTTRTWSAAGTYCSNLTLASYSDWRLPKIEELQRIVNLGKRNPSIDTTYFTSTQSSRYWSSTASVYITTNAHEVDFLNGSVSYRTKTNSFYVRCVRGEQTSTSYTDNGNETVTDRKTGLVWQKGDDGTTRNWETALSYCEGLTLGGKTDWRLPNIKELSSIVDYTDSNKAAEKGTFTIDDAFSTLLNSSSVDYWSSTTYLASTSSKWAVGFYVSAWIGGLNTNGYYVRCVRGG
jgi:hypothetical protein